jgi:hypothetical protein
MELIVYEEDKPKVLSALKDGCIDYADLTSWTFVDKFFAFLLESGFFDKVSESFPEPRERINIPTSFMLASLLLMRLKLEPAYHNYPYLIRSGTILGRLKFNIGTASGKILNLGNCNGFNNKNKKMRKAPIDHDTLRKFAINTEPSKLSSWYNQNVTKFYIQNGGFNKKGFFVLDSTLLEVPNNPNYENSEVVLVDKHNHLVGDPDKLSRNQLKECRWIRAYKLTYLLHLHPEKSCFLIIGLKVSNPKAHDFPLGKELVDEFIAHHGIGTIHWLIMDRGYLDGGWIGKLKTEYKIDALIPVRSNMGILKDAIGLSSFSETKWKEYDKVTDKDKKVVKRSQVTLIPHLESWEECPIPLNMILTREENIKKNEISHWGLITPGSIKPCEGRERYALRSEIEERNKQLKHSWKLTAFTSPDYSLVISQIVFVTMAFSLVQLYISSKKLQNLAHRTMQTWRARELMGCDAVIVYYKNNFAIFDLIDYQTILLGLKEEPRRRLYRKSLRLRKRRFPP